MIVLFNPKTQAFKAPTGLLRGSTQFLQEALFFNDIEEARELLGKPEVSRWQPMRVHVQLEPVDG